MSDHHSHHAPTATSTAPLFSQAEIEEFDREDVQAGAAIGKMLSALFLYTVVAMSIAGWWTWSSINAREASSGKQSSKPVSTETHD